MIAFELILSSALIFGPGCEYGCQAAVGPDAPPPGKYVVSMTKFRGYSQSGASFCIYPRWTPKRAHEWKYSETPRARYGCVIIDDTTFNALPERKFLLMIRK